ncbi:MAG TPA: peptide-methionine (S)-S-oxide reductase, partial [Phycisphaerales bacterium]|nr:peptide-methionine (S)-S-oxide reductase [Phycisphaerales bacterium]
MSEAMFGAGCFWSVEHAFRQVEGVTDTEVGYAGGTVENPTYERVCAGDTGHAEVVRVEFEPSVITYDQLLDAFFACHDPTQRDRQGPDIGKQYRSAIFYFDEAQREAAERKVEALK